MPEPRFDRCYRAVDYTFRIRSTLPEIGPLIDPLLAPFRTAPVVGVPTYSLTVGTEGGLELVLPKGRRPRADDLMMAVDFILWDISRQAIESAHGYLALHAGAVSWRGRGVIFPAPPDFGKTTLVAGLTEAGFAYLSDEVALIDRRGLLHPFPRPLTMGPASVEALSGLRGRLAPEYRRYEGPQFHVGPEQIRRGALGEPCRVSHVVAPRYRKGKTTLTPISRAEAVYLLAQNSFNFEKHGARALTLLSRVLRDVRCYRLDIGDLDGAVAVVLDLVRDRTQSRGMPAREPGGLG